MAEYHEVSEYKKSDCTVVILDQVTGRSEEYFFYSAVSLLEAGSLDL